MREMTIGEVACKVGVTPSTIRYYESVDLLPAPQRSNGQRRYDSGILQKLGLIQMAQHAGFTVSEIHTLLHDFPEDTPPSARWQALASKKLAEINSRIERAYAMKNLLEYVLQCHCPKLEECIALTEDTKTGKLDVKMCCEEQPT